MLTLVAVVQPADSRPASLSLRVRCVRSMKADSDFVVVLDFLKVSELHFREVARSRVKGLEPVHLSVLGKAGKRESLQIVIY
jgi:hypothetical protein